MLLSVVIPIYNEQDVLPSLFTRLMSVLEELDSEFEVLVVDDGSKDHSANVLKSIAESDARVKAIHFSRNFGQQAAITAGMDFALGDAVVVMDADLQDPPELLAEMLAKYREGFDIVSCQRSSREGESKFKKLTASAFYELMRRTVDSRIPPEVGDFRLMSRGAIQALRGFRESHRFMRGLVAWLGLREALIPFPRPARFAGETKYPLSKLIKLAWTAISSYSALPLKLSFYAGAATLILGMAISIFTGIAFLGGSNVAPSLGVLFAGQLLLNGATLIGLGLIGDYVGRIYDESKRRPLYIVSRLQNIVNIPHPDRAIILDPDHRGQYSDSRSDESRSNTKRPPTPVRRAA